MSTKQTTPDLMENVERRLGWIRGPKDPNDRIFAGVLPSMVASLPTVVDLRASMAPVPIEDQGQIGSCTANATVGAMEYNRDVVCKFPKHLDLSRLWLYYQSRAVEGTTSEDAGAIIRDVVKVAATKGVPPESLWPYIPKKFATKPPALAAQAKQNRIVEYQKVIGLDNIRAALSLGHLVVFGFTVPESFMGQDVASTGVVPLWKRSERMLGGHCVIACGYDTQKTYPGAPKGKSGVLICRNSWGAAWGDKGYFYLPFPYILTTSMSDDFWTISRCQFEQ